MRRRLTSYVDRAGEDFAFKKGLKVERVVAAPDLFLDSGAFTAWTKGTKIDLDAYADFALAHRDVFTVVANLDVIPGAPGAAAPTSAAVERAAAQGWEHYEHLRRRFAGCPFTLLHAYHYGEDSRWLKKLMDQAEYLAVGGIATPGLTTGAKRAFLDGIMPLLTDDAGRPVRRFHGFGVTGLSLMRRYPWYSVDSTSWLMATRFGSVHVPLGERVHVVTFSSGSPKMEEAGAHFTTYAPPEQAAIRAYVEGKGYAVEQLASDYVKRSELNVIFFVDLESAWVDQPWCAAAVQPSFFGGGT